MNVRENPGQILVVISLLSCSDAFDRLGGYQRRLTLPLVAHARRREGCWVPCEWTWTTRPIAPETPL